MKLVVAAVVLAFASVGGGAGCRGSGGNAPTQRLTPKQIVERSKPAIVQVEAGNDRIGTGFVVDASGIIATNLHVVAGSSDMKIRLIDGKTLPVVGVVGYDPDHDLALLDVDPSRPLPILVIGNSDAVAAGDPVLAIGNPLGLGYTVSDGLISSVREFTPEVTLLQISAPISHGSSGGPLFNGFGEVVGVATAIFAEGQNLNFGVPANYLARLIAQPQPVSLDEFVAQTGGPPPTESSGSKIVRKIPGHDPAILRGCMPKDIVEAVAAVNDAIELGAPLYNQGNHAACFRIYEGTSTKLERDSACKGVREALGAGLLRASTLTNPTAQAWALRDAFDGLLDVATRHFKQLSATSGP